jgi:V/A-type H+/Na+-transporting ATPase subunit D
MSRIEVPSTKSSLLRLRSNLSFLEVGRDLLKQKRDVLSESLLALHRDSAEARRRVEARLSEAYDVLGAAHAALGRDGVERAVLAATPCPGPRVRERSLMGVVVPVVQLEETAVTHPLVAAPGERGAAADATAVQLRTLVPSLGELAELETSCERLANELARTQRKLNALELLHIPAHRATIRFIADQLEERDREGLFQLKRVKALARTR